MKIVETEGATRWLGASQGYLPLPLRDVVINDDVTGPETPAMESAWIPSPEDLRGMVAGAPLILRVLGTRHPPVMIEVADPPSVPFVAPDASGQSDFRSIEARLARAAWHQMRGRQFADYVREQRIWGGIVWCAWESILEEMAEHHYRRAREIMEIER